MILDVNSPLPNQSLNRGAPWESYTSTYLNRTFAVIEAFKDFDNTLGFFSGNEVINQQSVIQVPSYIRAVTRDLKDYIAKNVNRTIPVGYSAADVRSLLGDTWYYLGCNIANSTSSKIDFFGLNSYSWCGNSSFTTSSYNQLIAQFSNTTIPVFFSEYGCNIPSPRIFTEVPVLYGPQMTGVMSGGLVYEWDQAVNNYGLVNVNSNGTADLLQDYLNLQAQYLTLDIKALMSANATATNLQPPTCDQSLITTPDFDGGFNIPARPAGVDDMINNGIQNKPQGKLVALSSTTVSQAVYNVSGQQITGLKLNVLPEDESNTPGSNESGSSSSTATSSSPSATSSSAAVKGADVKAEQLVLAALALGLLV
jgi:1,3-beta-glucanosyltransferase GAS3